MGNHRVRFGLQFATVPMSSGPRSGYGWEIGPRCRGSEIAREMWRRRRTGKAVWETRRPFSVGFFRRDRRRCGLTPLLGGLKRSSLAIQFGAMHPSSRDSHASNSLAFLPGPDRPHGAGDDRQRRKARRPDRRERRLSKRRAAGQPRKRRQPDGEHPEGAGFHPGRRRCPARPDQGGVGPGGATLRPRAPGRRRRLVLLRRARRAGAGHELPRSGERQSDA